MNKHINKKKIQTSTETNREKCFSLFKLKLTAMMLKKSSSPSVSNMEETVCLAMVSLSPFMLPLTSTKITTSLGDVAA